MRDPIGSIQDWLRETSADAALPATAIGEYVLIRKIGQGGMGTVYEADDPDLRRKVALKVLREDEENSTAVKRLHREAAAVAHLHHPNIVTVHDVGSCSDPMGRQLHSIAMDLVEGRTLAQVIAEGGAQRRRLLEMLLHVSGAVA